MHAPGKTQGSEKNPVFIPGRFQIGLQLQRNKAGYWINAQSVLIENYHLKKTTIRFLRELVMFFLQYFLSRRRRK